jgi:hypothetical protein
MNSPTRLFSLFLILTGCACATSGTAPDELGLTGDPTSRISSFPDASPGLSPGCTCTPGEHSTISCDDGGVIERTCRDDCTWDRPASCGATTTDAATSEVDGGAEGAASSDGASSCVANPECAPGTVDTASCGNCGMQSRTCGNDCRWSAYGDCGGQGECDPTQTSVPDNTGCGQCQTGKKSCTKECKWSPISCSGTCPDPCAPVPMAANGTPGYFCGSSNQFGFTSSQTNSKVLYECVTDGHGGGKTLGSSTCAGSCCVCTQGTDDRCDDGRGCAAMCNGGTVAPPSNPNPPPVNKCPPNACSAGKTCDPATGACNCSSDNPVACAGSCCPAGNVCVSTSEGLTCRDCVEGSRIAHGCGYAQDRVCELVNGPPPALMVTHWVCE